MPNRWIASGRCNVGAGVRKLTLGDGFGIAGYSWIGNKGTKGKDELYARALSFGNDADDTVAVICIVDLAYLSLP